MAGAGSAGSTATHLGPGPGPAEAPVAAAGGIDRHTGSKAGVAWLVTGLNTTPLPRGGWVTPWGCMGTACHRTWGITCT